MSHDTSGDIAGLAASPLAVLDALREAHERHIVHRDVTSSNVLVDQAGRVKVADFGIARMGASAFTRTGAMLGTSSYLSPEQAQGRSADERSDLYSLGAKVPGLTGRTRDEAVAALRKDGLRPVVHEVWADHYDVGVVARQRPREGVKVDDGAKVDLWVSRGPLHIPSPDLTGMRSAAATALLERESLTARKRKAATRNVPKGDIYRQEPAAGATVTRGDTVTFWVSSGPPMVTVPDVVGLSSGDASAALEAEGFVVSIDLVAGWGEFPGDVVEQDPVAGSRLRKGDEVVIKVAVF